VTKYLVRSDIGIKPQWLREARSDDFAPHYGFCDTSERKEAHVFEDLENAEHAASMWSDVPGVWYVTRLNGKPVHEDQALRIPFP